MKRRVLRALVALGVLCAAGLGGCKEAGGPTAEPDVGIIEVESPQAPAPSEPSFQDHLEAIASDAVLKDALARLAEEGELPGAYAGPDALIHLRRDLIVEPTAGLGPPAETRRITIRLQRGSAEDPPAVVRAVLRAYMDHEKARCAACADRIRELDALRETLRPQVAEAEQKVHDLRQSLSLTTTDLAADEHQVRLDALKSLLHEKQGEFDRAKADWQRFQDLREKAAKADDLSILLAAFPDISETVEADGGVAAARDNVKHLEETLAEVQARGDEDAVRRTQERLDEARQNLQARRAVLLCLLIQQKTATLERDYDRAVRAEKELQNEIAQARDDLEKHTEGVKTYRADAEELERLRNRLASVEEEETRLRVEMSLVEPPVRVLQWP